MKHLKLRPSSVRVMGRIYLIEYLSTNSLGVDCVGLCDHRKLLISVMDAQHPVEEADTLLHEIMHAVFFTMSIAEGGADEEQVVRRMATGLMGVFMDNPELLKYFSSIKNYDLKGL